MTVFWLGCLCYINANSNLSHTMCNLSALRYPILLLALLCASCGTALPSIKPYKLDVQQGNVVTSKMLLQLRPGMTQSQVRFIMGTPLVQDSFHGKRWDYVYLMRENGKITEQRRVILDFENDLLKTVRGDVIPSSGDPSKSNEVADNTGTRVINPSAKSEDKSLFSSLKFWEKTPAASPAPAANTKAEESAKEAVAPAVATETKPSTDAAATPEPPSVLAVPVLPEASPAVPAVETPAPVAVTAPSAEAVPTTVEAVPAPAQPSAAAVEQTPATVESAPVSATPVEAAPVEAAPVESVPVQTPVESSPVESAPVVAPSQVYDSPSGMQFERNLSNVPEDIAPPPAPKPEALPPPAAAADLPKAKELAATPQPSFFDRMLEKIGF